MTPTLADAAITVLRTADAVAKARASRHWAAAWRSGAVGEIGRGHPDDRPARPALPALRPPADMPKRRKAGSPASRIALLHALAHIELNAVDLSWDVIARFSDPEHARVPLPRPFFDDWVQVADEEGKHFLCLEARLRTLGSGYGALPAHDGLWQSSQDTAHDLAARLAVVPMVLEARGLDVTPAMIASLRRHGDDPSADILQMIHDDEIGHVAIGKRWFEHVCAHQGHEPIGTWQSLVTTYFKGVLKRPFNYRSREAAGFAAAYYDPIAPAARPDRTA